MSAIYNQAWDYIDLVLVAAIAATALYLGILVF